MIKRARFTDEQSVRILQGADRAPVAEVAKRHGVSEPSIYAWRTAFGLVFVPGSNRTIGGFTSGSKHLSGQTTGGPLSMRRQDVTGGHTHEKPAECRKPVRTSFCNDAWF